MSTPPLRANFVSGMSTAAACARPRETVKRRGRRLGVDRIGPRPGAVAQLVEHLLGRRRGPNASATCETRDPASSVRFALASRSHRVQTPLAGHTFQRVFATVVELD